VPGTFDWAVVANRPAEPINVVLARRQHLAYVEALRQAGLDVIEIPGDDSLSDCCFVEDCAVVAGGAALITIPGAPSRQGEPAAIGSALAPFVRTVAMQPPATLDGGDCLRIARRIYIGQSARTNSEGIEQARRLFEPLHHEVIPVALAGALHLKCVCSYLGGRKMLLAEDTLDPSIFAGVEIIPVPRDEAYAANCVSVHGQVLMAQGYERTRNAVQAAGFKVVLLDNSEFKKADGALTCLSILF
jgi:dimethylargininase